MSSKGQGSYIVDIAIGHIGEIFNFEIDDASFASNCVGKLMEKPRVCPVMGHCTVSNR